MIKDRFFRGRLIALFIVGMLLFNFPIFSLFSRPLMVLGIPLTYLYIFLAWCLVIVLILLITYDYPTGSTFDTEDISD